MFKLCRNVSYALWTVVSSLLHCSRKVPLAKTGFMDSKLELHKIPDASKLAFPCKFRVVQCQDAKLTKAFTNLDFVTAACSLWKVTSLRRKQQFPYLVVPFLNCCILLSLCLSSNASIRGAVQINGFFVLFQLHSSSCSLAQDICDSQRIDSHSVVYD